MAITSRDILILSDAVDLDDVEEEEESESPETTTPAPIGGGRGSE